EQPETLRDLVAGHGADSTVENLEAGLTLSCPSSRSRSIASCTLTAAKSLQPATICGRVRGFLQSRRIFASSVEGRAGCSGAALAIATGSWSSVQAETHGSLFVTAGGGSSSPRPEVSPTSSSFRSKPASSRCLCRSFGQSTPANRQAISKG